MTTRTPPRLIERDQELRLLADAWRQAASGHGSLWFLCAEAGGGKTRLAREVATSASRGARLLWGEAEPVSPPEPYLALIRAVPGFTPAPSRGESVAEAVRLLAEAAGDAPLLLVLDDLHFADEATAAVVVRLATECAARPWLVLAALRLGEGAAALHAGMTELVAQGRARRLDLAPLTPDGVATLVSDIRGSADAHEIDAILADSGGNPWFVEALARGSGAVTTARDRMRLRLDRLEAATPGANAVLAALAPATRPLSYAVMATLCGGDTPNLRRVLSRLRDAGVLVEQDGDWEFRHELMRRSLMEGMIVADQQDAHRTFAETLEAHGITRAAELAMHYAAAGDARAAAWALRAARQAADVDAHQESLAQLERALRFDLEPETRRTALRAASLEAHRLGRFYDSRRLAEDGLAIPDGEPEVRSLLHQRAADAARLHGDGAAAAAHMDAAERVLDGRPPSFQMGYLAAGRVLQAAVGVDPVRAAAAAERALDIARRLDDPAQAARIEVETKAFFLVSLIDGGDPAGFELLEWLQQLVDTLPRAEPEFATTLLQAYQEAVISLFQARAADLHERYARANEQHELGWMSRAGPYRVLELVQRGQYQQARAHAATMDAPAAGTIESVVLACAESLCEARAGSIDRAQAALASAGAVVFFRARALCDLVRLELAMLAEAPALAGLAEQVYQTTEPRRYARVAGVAALALARSGRGAPRGPRGRPGAPPLRVLWEWADGIARRDHPRLRDVAARLEVIELPYESALALADAGDLGAAYRALSALGAGHARRRLAEQLRAAAQPIPRRTRAAIEADGLTPTEREVCRLLATGVRNEQMADTLGISVRTVETHLGRIYQKTGVRGRVALAAWWRERAGPV